MKPIDAHWTCPNHPLAGPGVSGRAVAPLCHRPGCDYKTTMAMVHSFGCDGTHEVGDCNRLAVPATPRPVNGPPPPAMSYEDMWKVLSGYVAEAVLSPRPDDAKAVQGTMRNLEHQRRAPIKAWMDGITGKAAAK